MQQAMLLLNEEWTLPSEGFFPLAEGSYIAAGWAFRSSKGVFCNWLVIGELSVECGYYKTLDYLLAMLRASAQGTVSDTDIEDEVESAFVWASVTESEDHFPDEVKVLLGALRKESKDGKENGKDQSCTEAG